MSQIKMMLQPRSKRIIPPPCALRVHWIVFSRPEPAIEDTECYDAEHQERSGPFVHVKDSHNHTYNQLMGSDNVCLCLERILHYCETPKFLNN